MCINSSKLKKTGKCCTILKIRKKKTFYCEGGQILEQVAQKSCRDNQRLSGHRPEQPAVAEQRVGIDHLEPQNIL